MPKLGPMLVAVATSLALAACGSGEGPATSASGSSPQVSKTPSQTAAAKGPKASPEWSGPTFRVTTFEGETFDLGAQAGRPVVLNFWESW